MTNYYLKNPVYSLLLVVILFTSCKGQAKTNLAKDSEPKTIAGELPKIPKPRGYYKDASIGTGFQDKSGNIWFGSNGEGVYRYDGKTFTNFTVKDGLDNNIVYSILEDKTGNIWVGTKTGLNRYEPSPKNGGKTFTRIPITATQSNTLYLSNLPNTDPSHLNGVWSMMQDKKGTIWFGTDDGVYCYNGTYFTHFLDNNNIINKNGLKLKAIFSILEDKTGNVWFAACIDEGISRFDGKTLTNIVPHKDVLRVNRMIEDKSGNIWFAASFNGLCRYEPSAILRKDGKTFTKNVFNEKKGYKSTVLNDKAGNIWFDTFEGLGYYDPSLNEGEKTFKTLTEKDGLPHKNMIPILEDKSGNLWFSSVGMGLYRYDASGGKTFTNFSE